MSSFTHKIEEWMKEAEARPESAVTIVRLIARRLGELTARNEELLAENIALQNGTSVEEYQKRFKVASSRVCLLLPPARKCSCCSHRDASAPARSMRFQPLNLAINGPGIK